MSFRKVSPASIALVAICFVVAAAYASTASWWHGLSQSQRDSRIVSRAQSDTNHSVGLECKEWVRQVVLDASHNEFTIPSARSNGYEWNSSSYIASYSRGCPPPGAASGHVIQMLWHNAGNGQTMPHTAIILSSNGSSMTWIDCNWNGDGRVRIHDVTYSQFNSCVGNHYTIYQIR